MKTVRFSLHSTKAKRLILLLLVLAAAAAALLWTSLRSGIPGKTEEDRQSYLRSLGWEPCLECGESKNILLPEEFPEVLQNYNELQLQQGFDLTKYAGREIKMYTYELSENPAYPDAECSLYVYHGKIIGGDVHSPGIRGYMLPLNAKENG